MSQLLSSLMFGGAAAIAVQQAQHLGNRNSTKIKIGAKRRASLREAIGLVRGTESGLQSVLRTQILAALIASIIGVVLVAINPDVLMIVSVVAVVAASWQIPLIINRSRERKRRTQFEIELSDALSEMVMGVEAGLTLEAVINQYSKRHNTSLGSEFALVLDRINLGASRIAALEEFRDRTPTPGVRMFVSAVQQNQKLGTPLAAVLRQQGQTARRRRRQAVEEHAAKLSLKMIFPTIFCILPVLLIVVVGPALIRMIDTFPK
ncbi:MAG: type II secretion system F family protein [Ilumatobacteraceae bacterium]